MKLYSYIVTHDTGFAPNPFWGFCTLACCKPVIRRKAEVGDWIVGLSPKPQGNKIIYVMEVQEILTMSEYFLDARFKNKIPNYNKSGVIYKCGDNICQPLSNSNFRQLQSMHSNGKNEDYGNKQRDLSGANVLISKKYYYFGSRALPLPTSFEELIVGRAHKNKFTAQFISSFLKFIQGKNGIHASPSKWPHGDHSWSMGQ